MSFKLERLLYSARNVFLSFIASQIDVVLKKTIAGMFHFSGETLSFGSRNISKCLVFEYLMKSRLRPNAQKKNF